mgnify:CR=1 FL=1
MISMSKIGLEKTRKNGHVSINKWSCPMKRQSKNKSVGGVDVMVMIQIIKKTISRLVVNVGFLSKALDWLDSKDS